MTRTARPVLGSVVAATMLVVLIVACGTTATPAPATRPAGATPPAAALPPRSARRTRRLRFACSACSGLGNSLPWRARPEAAGPDAGRCPSSSASVGPAGAAAGQIPAFYGDFRGATGSRWPRFTRVCLADRERNSPGHHPRSR
jgi:hypothetical protein